MNLFDDLMLFDEGKKKFTDFALPVVGLYEHHVPKTKKAVGPRINLTFRIQDFITKKSYA